ncbi:1,2-dihydroxy-3-keto-5-methylthiopentene dioxygenase 1, partial [Frankliniella fusca]
AWYLDDANKDQYDPNYKQPTSYDVDGRNYDDPNNNLYDPNYRQPSSFDTTYGAGGAYGSQPYGSRGYYGRYNAATASSAPMALVATLMAGVLALGVLADRR